MIKDMLQKFRQIFEEQKLRLSSPTPTMELDGDGDEMDQAQANVLGSLAQNISIRNMERIKHINKALKKMEDGLFGECEECGELISEPRLMAMPDADTCIVCAEKLEKQSRQFR